jgi:hypothetical protein
MKRLAKYSLVFDFLLMLNFCGALAAALAASITHGDARLTLATCTINTFVILICRMTDRKGGKHEQAQRTD